MSKENSNQEKFKELNKNILFPIFDKHPFDCSHNFKFSSYRNLVCVDCGTTEEISYFVLTHGNDNDVFNKYLIKGTTSLVADYVEKEFIGKENINQWEDTGDLSWITYYDNEEPNDNEDSDYQYNENIQVDDLELSDTYNNKENIQAEIDHYKSYYGGFINLIEEENN